MKTCARAEIVNDSVELVQIRYIKLGWYEVGPREHLHIWPAGFRLAPSDLTLDDTKESKIKVILLTWNMSRTATATMLDITEIAQTAHRLHVGWPWEVTAMDMWGYTPVRITDALVCLSADFCNGHLRRGSTQGDEIWQVNFYPGVNRKAKKWKIDNALDSLCSLWGIGM